MSYKKLDNCFIWIKCRKYRNILNFSRLKIILSKPFHILWGDNVYEIIWPYFNYCFMRFGVQRAFCKAVIDVSVTRLLRSDRGACRAVRKVTLRVANYQVHIILWLRFTLDPDWNAFINFNRFDIIKYLRFTIINYYHLVYSDNSLHLYCYIPNVSARASFGFLQVFLVELGSLHRNESNPLFNPRE